MVCGFLIKQLKKYILLKKILGAIRELPRVIVQGVKSLGGHFACLCRGFDFYELNKDIFQKEQ